MKKFLVLISLFLIVSILIQGCVSSTATLADFSTTANIYDFNRIAALKKTSSTPRIKPKGEYEYFIKTNIKNRNEIVSALHRILENDEFKIKLEDDSANAIIAERDRTITEWKTIAGLYYQEKDSAYNIYVRCKITQDASGGYHKDRAEKVASSICNHLKSCIENYAVATDASAIKSVNNPGDSSVIAGGKPGFWKPLDSIEVRKNTFWQNGKILTPLEAYDIALNCPAAVPELKKMKKNLTPAFILSYIGGALVGWSAGYALSGHKFNLSQAGIGLGLVGIAIPFTSAAHRHLKNGVRIYNRDLKRE